MKRIFLILFLAIMIILNINNSVHAFDTGNKLIDNPLIEGLAASQGLGYYALGEMMGADKGTEIGTLTQELGELMIRVALDKDISDKNVATWVDKYGLFLEDFFDNLNLKGQGQGQVDTIISKADAFIDVGKKWDVEYINQSSLNSVTSDLYNLFFLLGIIVAVIIGVVLGIQFVTSGVEGKAKVKEALIAYVIGCCVIFGSVAIWKICINTLGQI